MESLWIGYGKIMVGLWKDYRMVMEILWKVYGMIFKSGGGTIFPKNIHP